MSTKYPGVPRMSSLDSQQGTATLLAENFPGFRQTDAQFSISGPNATRRGIDIINPHTKERLYLTQGSDVVSESILDNYFVRRNIGASVLQLAEDGGSAVSSGNNLQTYVVPSGARLLAPSLKDPAYNELYLARLSHRIGTVMKSIQKLDPGLYGIDLNAVAIIHEDDEVGDDTEFAIIPPLASAKKTDTVGEYYVDVASFIRTGEYPTLFVESFINGVRSQ